MVSTPACHAGGRGFEPLPGRQKKCSYKNFIWAFLKNLHASVAQSVEQGTENPCVGGSIPPRGTKLFLYKHSAGVAQLAEQLICNQQVAGSIPVTSSTT